MNRIKDGDKTYIVDMLTKKVVSVWIEGYRLKGYYIPGEKEAKELYEVIAWMPLPEPYKVESEGKE